MKDEDRMRIDALKDQDNPKPFKYWSGCYRGWIRRAGKENCLWLSGGGSYEPCTNSIEFCDGRIYVIKPDWQPEPEEPEYEWRNVEVEDGYLQVSDNDVSYWSICYVIALPTFAGYWITLSDSSELRIHLDSVADYMAEGKPVRAKFRKASNEIPTPYVCKAKCIRPTAEKP